MRQTPSRALGALLIVVAISACSKSGGSGGNDVVIPCNPAGAEEIATAVPKFVTGITPLPRRFLVATSGDSALPTSAQAALQAKGPMYLFPSDPAQQSKILARLQQNGKFPTILVLFAGMKQVDKGHLNVQFAGRFEGGDEAGRQVPVTTIRFGCRDGQWQLDTTKAAAAP